MHPFSAQALTPFGAPDRDVQLVIFFGDQVIHLSPEYLERCRTYAVSHKVFLVSELGLAQKSLCLYMFSPQGEIVCRQAALYPVMPFSGALEPGETVQITHTSLGNFCLCVDEDIHRPQVLRTAALKGADIAISMRRPGLNAESAPTRLLQTVWNGAQSNELYVVGLDTTGLTVCCPAAMTRAKDGWLLRQSPPPVRFGLNIGRLDTHRHHNGLAEYLPVQIVENHFDLLRRGL